MTLTQEPDGCVTLEPLMERCGLYGTAELLGVEHRTVQRYRKRGVTLSIAQARDLADVLGVRVREVWPELASVDEGTSADRDDWESQAKCRGADPDMFFADNGPEANNKYELVNAMFCSRCPVRAECLEDALLTEERLGRGCHGFVGGETPKGRAVLLNAREEAARRKARG